MMGSTKSPVRRRSLCLSLVDSEHVRDARCQAKSPFAEGRICWGFHMRPDRKHP
jgi:hypothetical protein